MKKMNKRGFTIVELSIVIAVIAILSAVLIPTFTGIVNKSKKSAALQQADSALTVIIGEEDAQLKADYTYYFIVGDYWFSYNTEDRVLDEADAIDPANVGATDTVYTAEVPTYTADAAEYTFGVLTTGVKNGEDAEGNAIKVPDATIVTSEDLAKDLGDIIVWVKAN